MFDEFMKELRRRQAEASGRPLPDDDVAPAGDEAASGEDAEADADTDAETAAGTVADATERGEPIHETGGGDGPPARDRPGPTPLRRGQRGRGPASARGGATPPPPPPRQTRTGGPRDGGISLRSRLTTIAVVAVILFVALMFAVGIELWTDVLWYR